TRRVQWKERNAAFAFALVAARSQLPYRVGYAVTVPVEHRQLCALNAQVFEHFARQYEGLQGVTRGWLELHAVGKIVRLQLRLCVDTDVVMATLGIGTRRYGCEHG